MANDASSDPEGRDSDADLRAAYEALARRVVEDRLAFADRVQEVQDHAHRLQAELEETRRQRDEAKADTVALRARVEELHDELVSAHDNQRAIEQSRSYRYLQPLRDLGKVFRRR